MPPLDAAVLRTADASVQWLTGPLRPLTRFGERPLFREGLYRLGIGVYAWMVPNGSWGETNIGLIQGQGQSLLVDTCWDLGYTQEMLEAAQDILRTRPIEWVVNTHADGDHTYGNQFLAGAEIIGEVTLAEDLAKMPPSQMQEMNTNYEARGAGGRFFYEMMGKRYDFSDIALTLPTRTFKGHPADKKAAKK